MFFLVRNFLHELILLMGDFLKILLFLLSKTHIKTAFTDLV